MTKIPICFENNCPQQIWHFQYMTAKGNLSTPLINEYKFEAPQTDFELNKNRKSIGIYVTLFFINTWLWTRLICTMNNLWLTITLAWQSNIAVCFYKWRQHRYFDKQHFCLQTIWCMVLSLNWHTCKRPKFEIIAILFARHSTSRKGVLFWPFTSRNPSKTIQETLKACSNNFYLKCVTNFRNVRSNITF